MTNKDSLRYRLPLPWQLSGRAWRRRLVLGIYIGYLAFAAVCWAVYALRGGGWVEGVGFVFLFAGLAANIALSDNMRRWRMSAKEADERWRSMRDHAHYAAYRIFFLVVSVFLSLPYWAAQFGRDLSFLGQGSAPLVVFGGCVLLGVTLPDAVIAWTAPDVDD